MLPWSNPSHDVVGDIKRFVTKTREEWPPPPFVPVLPKDLVMHREDRMDRSYDSVAIVSGGLDSTTLLYDMIDKGFTPHVLSFNYGQRHKKELQYATLTARTLNLRHDVVDLQNLTHLISNSALTSGTNCTCEKTPLTYDGPHRDCPEHGELSVPEGHYAEDTMKATVVPNRNMIMLSIAAGVAVNNKYKTIGIGVHAGDHFVYPDCRPEFIKTVAASIDYANEGFANFDYDVETGPLHAPFMNSTKDQIAYRAIQLHVPFHMTWSCYKGGANHCGKCGTCVERLEAIDKATARYNINHDTNQPFDQTDYEDSEFWKSAIRAQS